MKPTNEGQRLSRHGRYLGVALVVAIVGSWLLAGCGTAPGSTSTVMPATAAQVEERYGVQLTLIGLTAANGLIDCRFRITDPAKAAFLLKADTMPQLIVEKSDTVIQVQEPIDQVGLILGRVYSVVFPNLQNAIEPGDEVSVVIGDLRLEHILAQ